MTIEVPKRQANWQQQVLLPVLGAAERGVASARRWSGPALDRLQLRLKVWRTALDPATAVWIEEAKRSVEDGSAAARAWTADDLRRLIEERRKLAE
jgi:hypothetical protein